MMKRCPVTGYFEQKQIETQAATYRSILTAITKSLVIEIASPSIRAHLELRTYLCENDLTKWS